MERELFEIENDEGASPSPLFMSKLYIAGFWGNRDVSISFDKQANFLIGPNGCGKTTIVNLLAACLLVDIPTLERIEFTRVEIELSDENQRSADIVVNKSAPSSGQPYATIAYSLYDRRNANRTDFVINEFERHAALHDPKSVRRRLLSGGMSHFNELRRLCNVTWLSVHRSDFGTRERDERSYDSLVDIKLAELSNSLVRYFSRLNQEIADSLREFQQIMFLSLLADGGDNWLFERNEDGLADEQEALLAIFEQFSMQRSAYVSKVDKHFKLVHEAYKKAVGNGWEISAISSILSQSKVHAVVHEWNKFQEVRASILRLRNEFITRVNKMLRNKEVFVTKANEVAFRTKSGRNLSLKALSSGEKQLLIIMAEALLQEGNPVIYIADEPELSLHIAWQEMLVSNIRGINERAQIIFATHSPDIVSGYGDKVIDALEVVRDGVR